MNICTYDIRKIYTVGCKSPAAPQKFECENLTFVPFLFSWSTFLCDARHTFYLIGTNYTSIRQLHDTKPGFLTRSCFYVFEINGVPLSQICTTTHSKERAWECLILWYAGGTSQLKDLELDYLGWYRFF